MRRHLTGTPQGANAVTHHEVWAEMVLTHSPTFPNAPCASSGDPDLWFQGEHHASEARHLADVQAAEICGRCPHRLPCLNYALTNRIWSGVWGGTTEMERKAMLR